MAKKSRTTNSILNLVTGFGGHLLTTILDFVVRTVFIYTLGKKYLGINGLFTNILSVLSLANLGIGTAIVYRLYAPLANKDTHRVRVLIKFYKLAYKLIGCVVFGLGLLIIPLLPVLIKDYASLGERGINATVLFILFLLNSASSYWFLAYRTSVLNANQERYLVQIFNMITHTLTSIAKILILLFVRDFMIYTAVGIAIGILVSIGRGIFAKKRHPEFFEKEKDSISRQEVFDMLKDCGALFVLKINQVVVKASDNLILSSFIGLEPVGMYSNYMLFYRTFTSLFSQFLSSYKASLGNIYATGDVKKRYLFFKRTSFLASTVFGIAAVGVAVCANEVIAAWIGTEYVIPQPMPILIGIELYLVGILDNLGQVRHISGIFQQMWYRPLFSIVVNIVVSVVLAKCWGICGVTCGTIAAWVFTNYLIDPHLIFKYAFDNYKPVREYYLNSLSHIGVLTVITAIDMWVCSQLLVGHGWFSVAFHVLITGLSVPVAFAVLFWGTEECQYLVQLIRKIFKRVMNKF